MKTINTKQVLTTLKGEPLKSDNEEVTVGVVVSNVLSGKVDNPHRGYIFAKKFATEDTVDLKAEDVVYIKKELEKPTAGITGLVSGQIIEILDGTEDVKK